MDGEEGAKIEVEAPVAVLKYRVKAQQRTVGVCVRSSRLRTAQDESACWQLTSYEFLDNEEFGNLDSLLVQLGPGCVYVTLDAAAKSGTPKGDLAKLINLLERRKCAVEHAPAVEFKVEPDHLRRSLERLLSNASVLPQFTSELDRPLATGCLAALLSLLGMDAEADGTCTMTLGSLGQYTKLDSAAADAVTLLPDPNFPNQHGSLFNILNKCKTKMGTRMLERWLRQPLKDLAVIESRQDIVGVFLGAPVLRSALAEGPLRRAPDLESLRVRMQKKKAGLAEIFKLYGFAMTVPSFCDALGGADQELDEMGMDILRGQFTARFELLRDELVKFEELAEHVLDLSQLPDLRVNPEYSEELAELRAGMIEIEANISKIHAKAKKTWANLGEKSPCLLEKDKVRGGFIYRMTNSNVTSELKKRCPSVEITAILKNGVHFKCRDLRQASQKYVELAEQYEQQQKDLVTKALETANTYMPVMEIASEIVAELDVFVALATAAALAPIEYVRPKMLPAGTGVLKVEAARHPCLECQDDLDFIPNSYSMTKDKGRFLVVTGPNMGGKSTFIRTLGSIVVMAQMGSFVPADSAEISVVDAIFARVGAGDAQQRGVSTFMAEMLEASAILSSATDQSLIVVDELGRGTSTYDGFGLAWGISQYIVRELGAFTLFATHFHEMTTLADCETCVDNVHVSAKTEEDNITMLYHVKPGPCLQSFGIHVASMAGFPNSVIKEAKKKAAELERFETAMENLELQNSEGLKKRPAEEGKGMDSKRLHQAAEQFKNLPLDGMSPAEVLQAAMQLVSCMEAPKD